MESLILTTTLIVSFMTPPLLPYRAQLFKSGISLCRCRFPSRSHFGRAFLPTEANRKSLKLFSLIKIAEKRQSTPRNLNKESRNVSHKLKLMTHKLLIVQSRLSNYKTIFYSFCIQQFLPIGRRNKSTMKVCLIFAVLTIVAVSGR